MEQEERFEALLEAVVRIRLTQPTCTAAQVHALLVLEESWRCANLSEVKKACSKATKRQKAPSLTAQQPAAIPASQKRVGRAIDANLAHGLIGAVESGNIVAVNGLLLQLQV